MVGLAVFLLGGANGQDHTLLPEKSDSRFGLWSLWAARSAVQGGVGNALEVRCLFMGVDEAFSTPPAGSTGHRSETGPENAPGSICWARDDPWYPRRWSGSERSDDAHGVASSSPVVLGAALVRRFVGPLRSMR